MGGENEGRAGRGSMMLSPPSLGPMVVVTLPALRLYLRENFP